MTQDEILLAIEKYRKRSTLVRFFKSPREVIKEKPIYLLPFSLLCAIFFAYTALVYIKFNIYDTILLSVIVSLSIPALFDYYEKRRIRKIEDKFHDLLTDLAFSVKAGMDLDDALEIAAGGEYGKLTEEVKWIKRMMLWGLSFEEAMKKFAEKYPTPLIKSSVNLIIEVSRVGGKISEILEIAAENARESKYLERKRLSDVFPFIVVCYLSFFVFTVVIIVLATHLIPTLEEATKRAQEGSPFIGFVLTPQTVELYKRLFFHALIIQGLFNGLMAGKVGEGNIVAGFKHTVLFTLIATAVYVMFIK